MQAGNYSTVVFGFKEKYLYLKVLQHKYPIDFTSVKLQVMKNGVSHWCTFHC